MQTYPCPQLDAGFLDSSDLFHALLNGIPAERNLESSINRKADSYSNEYAQVQRVLSEDKVKYSQNAKSIISTTFHMFFVYYSPSVLLL